MADFFALLKSDEVRRVDLTRELQQQLEERFETGADRLRSEAIERVALDASGYRPDESEALVIEGFTLPEHMAAAIADSVGTPSLTGGELEEVGVKALAGSFSDAAVPWVGFQVRDRRDLMSSRSLNLILDGRVYRRLEEPGLMVGDDVHVVFTEDELYFLSLWWARRVFDLSDYYKEATDGDIAAFIDRADIYVDDPEAFVVGRNAWERRRIGAIQSSGILDRVGMVTVRERAAEYGVDVRMDTDGAQERLVLPSDRRELKEVLQFLEEKIYRGALTDTDFIANSRRPRNVEE